MDTNKMREQFEAMTKTMTFPVDLSRGNHGVYLSLRTHELYCSWVEAWNASREAVVVGLPPDDESRCDTSWEEARQEAYNRALSESRNAIKAIGLRVMP